VLDGSWTVVATDRNEVGTGAESARELLGETAVVTALAAGVPDVCLIRPGQPPRVARAGSGGNAERFTAILAR
jgi:hypothetical protein